MFCDNCGRQLNPGEKFCEACGKRVNSETENVAENTKTVAEESNFQITTAQKENESGVTVTSEPEVVHKKNRKWLKPTIIASILIVLTSVLVYAAPVIRNFAQKLYYSPEDYFKVVVKREIKQSTDDIGSMLTSFDFDSIFENGSASADLTIELGDGVKPILKEIENIVREDIYEYIDWLDTATVSFDTAQVDGNISAGVSLKINSEDILGYNVALEDDYAYIDFPGLSDEAIRLDISDFYGYNDFNPYKEFLNSKEYEVFKEIVSVLPDEKLTQKLIYRYVCCLIDQVNNVSESSDDVSAGDIEQGCTKLSARVDTKLLRDSSIAVLKKLKTDSDIKKTIKDFCEINEFNLDFDEVYSEFIYEIEDALEELESTEIEESFLVFNIDVWVNNWGEIAGWGISRDGVSFSVISLESGDEFGLSVNASAGFAQAVKFEGGGTISGNKRSGVFYLKAAGQNLLKVSLSDYNTKKFKNGQFEGNISFELGDDLKKQVKMLLSTPSIPYEAQKLLPHLVDLKLKIESKVPSAKSSSLKLALYDNSDLLVSLTAAVKEENAQKINIPQDYSTAYNKYDLKEWIEDLNYYEVLSALRSAGVPDELVDMLDRELKDEIYRSSDYDYDY